MYITNISLFFLEREQTKKMFYFTDNDIHVST